MSKAKVIWVVLDSQREDIFSKYNGGVMKELKRDSIYFSHAIAQSTFTPASFGSFLTSTDPYKTKNTLLNIPKEALMHKKKKGESAKDNYFKDVKLEVVDKPSVFDYFKNTFSCSGKILGEGFDYSKWNIHRENELKDATKFIKKHSKDEFLVFVRTIQTHIPWSNPIISGKIVGKKYEYFKTLKRLHFLYSNPVAYWPTRGFIMLAAKFGLDLFVKNRLGPIIKTLKEEGIYDESMIIISADHADNLHDNFKEGYEHIGHGFDVHESVTRVPILVKFPKNTGKSRKTDDIVRNVDILPTILTACGKKSKAKLDGVPLVGKTGRDLVAYSEGVKTFSLENKAAKLVVNLENKKPSFSYDKGSKNSELEKAAKKIIDSASSDRGDEELMVEQLKKLGYI